MASVARALTAARAELLAVALREIAAAIDSDLCRSFDERPLYFPARLLSRRRSIHQ